MKLLVSPETSVSLYKATQPHRTKANILHNLHRESHISPIGMYVLSERNFVWWC